MTKLEIRYGTRTFEVEVDMSLEKFLTKLNSTIWYVLEEGVVVQVKLIDSVKVVE